MLFASMLATATIVFGAAAPAPAPTADSIVADYIRARGGLAKIRSIQTLRQKGNAIGGAGREAVVLRELKRPGKSRFEFTVQGITGVFVVNGQDGWQVSPFSGDMSVQPMSKEALTDALEQADIEGPLVDWKAKGHQLELVAAPCDTTTST
jgi:outer membrane lipoprotein-sorting protein